MDFDPGAAGIRPDAGRDGVFLVLPELVARAPAGSAPDSRGGTRPSDHRAWPEGLDLLQTLVGEEDGEGPVIFSESSLAGVASLPGTALVLAAAFAARYPGREVGAGVGLPRDLPGVLRLAEEAATVDAVSGGRLHLVLVETGEEAEGALAAGEALQRLRRALAGGPLTTPAGEVVVHPRTAGRVGPRLWALGSDPVRAHALGLGHLGPEVPGSGPAAGSLLRLRVVDSQRRAGRALRLAGVPFSEPPVPPASARRHAT